MTAAEEANLRGGLLARVLPYFDTSDAYAPPPATALRISRRVDVLDCEIALAYPDGAQVTRTCLGLSVEESNREDSATASSHSGTAQRSVRDTRGDLVEVARAARNRRHRGRLRIRCPRQAGLGPPQPAHPRSPGDPVRAGPSSAERCVSSTRTPLRFASSSHPADRSQGGQTGASRLSLINTTNRGGSPPAATRPAVIPA